jgi:hypothetical protein
MSQLLYVTDKGYFFSDGTKFVSPSKLGYHNTHITARTYVQIKQFDTQWGLFLMKPNNIQTNNKEWLERNKFLFLSSELRTKYGSFEQKPSMCEGKLLQVFMLNTEIAEKFLKTDYLYLSKTEYKDTSLIIKRGYFTNFKYEQPSDFFKIPTTAVPKQVRSKATEQSEDNLVKIGNQLIQRPMRKVG